MLKQDRDQGLKLLGRLFHVAGIAGLLVAGGLYQTVVSALMEREQRGIVEETTEKEQFLVQAEEIRAEHKLLTERLAELEQNAVTMRQRIPEQPKEAEFLKHVSQAADDEGLKIHNYQRGTLERKRTHSEFTVRLSCEGNYSAIVGFLDRLANLSRVATVHSLSLTAGPTEPYPFDLSLVLYFGAQAAEETGS